MAKDSLQQLYVDELRDLYSAEKQLTKALPKMAKAATSPDLKDGFDRHLEQTGGHVERLKEIFGLLEERPTGKKCVGMEGLIKEGSEIMDEDFSDEVMAWRRASFWSASSLLARDPYTSTMRIA